MHISRLDKANRKAGLVPVYRGKLKDYDLFIADGFAPDPHIKFQRFGVERGEFPMGCYATMWALVKDGERVHIAAPVFFEALHDAAWDKPARQRGRINIAIKEAARHVEAAEKNRMDRPHGKPN